MPDALKNNMQSSRGKMYRPNISTITIDERKTGKQKFTFFENTVAYLNETKVGSLGYLKARLGLQRQNVDLLSRPPE